MKLTKLNLGHILQCISNRLDERGYYYTSKRGRRLVNSDYQDKILALNTLICNKCMEAINIGDNFKRNTESCRVQARYYHDSCYQKMFY